MDDARSTLFPVPLASIPIGATNAPVNPPRRLVSLLISNLTSYLKLVITIINQRSLLHRLYFLLGHTINSLLLPSPYCTFHPSTRRPFSILALIETATFPPFGLAPIYLTLVTSHESLPFLPRRHKYGSFIFAPMVLALVKKGNPNPYPGTCMQTPSLVLDCESQANQPAGVIG